MQFCKVIRKGKCERDENPPNRFNYVFQMPPLLTKTVTCCMQTAHIHMPTDKTLPSDISSFVIGTSGFSHHFNEEAHFFAVKI